MKLPGWNSLDSVRRLENFFEIAGFVALALLVVFEVLKIPGFFALSPLVVFEVLAYVYGRRSDSLNEDRQQQVVANLNSELAKSSKKITTIEARQYPRELTANQREQIISELKPFAGSRISILGVGGPEAGGFGEQIFKDGRSGGLVS